jgi:uncharacterized protein
MARGKRFPFLLALIVSLAFAACSWAALSIPALKGRVNDAAGMLSPGTRQQLEGMLAELEKSDSTQIAVLTMTSLEGEVLEEFSLKVAESWKIGQKGKDNGALLLIVKNDRKLRIETGYGLEGRLTDLQAGRIIRDVIRPKFRDGDFDGGILAGVTAMIAAVRGEFQGEAQAAPQVHTNQDDFFGLGIFLLFAFFGLARVAGRHPKLSALLGGILAPVVGFLFLGFQWLMLLALIGIGLVAGLIFALMFGRMQGSSGSGWVFSSGGSSSGGGSFSDSFSGGGGDFGGGGSSGDW